VTYLETKGVRIFSLSENTRTVDAFSCWRNGEPFIFLNTFKTTERSRFDAAHELGHLVLHKHGGPNQRDAEQQANAFASSFLMPRADVLATVPYASRLSDLIRHKKRWGVSAAALAYRLHRLKVITDWQYRTFVIQLKANYSDSEPESLPREKSHVWRTVLQELWREGKTVSQIARQLDMPTDEVGALLFGLTAEQQTSGANITLRAVP
jgi:Zn-dependent peptidase ImmA (M78 family)